MELKTTYRIAEILSKHFTDSLTEAEQVELYNWLDASENNKALFNKFSNKGFFEEKRLIEASIDMETAMLEFMERKYHGANRKKFFINYLKFTAAAVLFIVSALALYHYNKPLNTQQNFNTLEDTIGPGSKKAVLTLANGKKIYLNHTIANNISNHGTTVIKATDSSLQYHASDKLHVLTYNELETPEKSEFIITLDDGTKVWLNAGSKIRYPIAFVTHERRVELSGEAYFEVSRNKKKPFIIDIGTNSIQVLGTSFNVNAYANASNIYTTLVEGSVRINTLSQSMDLSPNEQGIINLKTKHIIKNPVDVNLYASWRNGRFIFDNQPLEEIMGAISRWYGIEVVFENEAARNFTFSFNVKRYDSLNDIIKLLEMTKQVTFKREGRTIYIKK